MDHRPINIWDVARDWLGGPLLGKLLRDHPEDTVKQAVCQTLLKNPAEPKAYLLALTGKAGDLKGSKSPWQLSERELVDVCQERGIPTLGKSRQDLINAIR